MYSNSYSSEIHGDADFGNLQSIVLDESFGEAAPAAPAAPASSAPAQSPIQKLMSNKLALIGLAIAAYYFLKKKR